MTFSQLQWSGVCWSVPSKVKDTSCTFYHKGGGIVPSLGSGGTVGIFGSWGQYIIHLGIPLALNRAQSRKEHFSRSMLWCQQPCHWAKWLTPNYTGNVSHGAPKIINWGQTSSSLSKWFICDQARVRPEGMSSQHCHSVEFTSVPASAHVYNLIRDLPSAEGGWKNLSFLCQQLVVVMCAS